MESGFFWEKAVGSPSTLAYLAGTTLALALFCDTNNLNFWNESAEIFVTVVALPVREPFNVNDPNAATGVFEIDLDLWRRQ